MDQLSIPGNLPLLLTYDEGIEIAHSTFFGILELLPCVTWIFNRQSQSFDFISQNISDRLGQSHWDYINYGYTFHEANIHENDCIRVQNETKNFWKMLDQNTAEQLPLSVNSSEYRMICKAGRVVSVLEQTSIFSRNADGYPTHLITCLFKKSDKQENEIDRRSVHFLNANRTSHSTHETMNKPKVEFTNREREVLKLLCEGKTSKCISEKLSISFHTVNTHRQKMIEKSGSNNIGEVISYAHANGII